MKVKDVMNTDPITCQAEDTVSEAARLMREKKISGMPVMDGDRLVGVISETDILRLLPPGEEEGELWLPSPFEVFEVPFRDVVRWERMHASVQDVSGKKVSEVMTRKVHKIWPDASVERAAQIMTSRRINRLPVLDGERVVGIVTRGDIISGLGAAREEA